MIHNPHNSKLSILALLAMAATASTALAEVTLPRFISSSMVLQRGDKANVWGKAAPQEQVTITFLKKRYNTIADADGRWMIEIPTNQKKMVGGPYKMQITGSETAQPLQLDDIYVGDVWLCTGQSNMDLHTARLVDLYKDEFDTDSNPAIHLVQTARNPTVDEPKDDVDGHGGFYAWESMKPENVGHWSGIGYFLAKEMYKATKGVPQGIISASMGGSDIVAWCSSEVLTELAPTHVARRAHLLQDGYVKRASQLSGVIGSNYSKLRDAEDPGLNGQWMAEHLDDSQWEVVNQYDPKLGDADGQHWVGSLWLRKEFNVPAEMVGKDSLLRLGCLVDADVTYVNGVKVGETGYQYPPRKYTLPQGLIKAGRNVVCIRLMSGGQRMMFMPEKPYKLLFHGGQEISLEGDWKLHRGVLMPNQPGVSNVSNATASSLYANVIHPLLPYRVAGIIWYQGETNAGRPDEYHTLLPAMINDWRKSYGDVPAVICGLANFQESHSDANYRGGWARLREAQRLGTQEMGNAGLAVLTDLGEWNDIHPLHKKEAAARIARILRQRCLGEKIVAEGPAYERVRFEGGKAIVSFREGTGTLAPAPAQTPAMHHYHTPAVNPDGTLNGFAICGKDRKYHWAKAKIEGSEVVVWSDEVKEPVAVRYGWDDDPIVSLYNSDGLPAASFCTE